MCLCLWLMLSACATPRAVEEAPPPAEPPPPQEAPLALAWEAPEAPPETPGEAEMSVDGLAQFRNALTEGRRQLQQRQFEAALTAAQEANRLAEQLDGDARLQAGQLFFKAQLAVAPDSAESAAVAWLLSCGPEKALNCRRLALQALSSVAQKRATLWQDAELCAHQAERNKEAPPCVRASLQFAADEGDAWLAQRLRLAPALHEDNEGKQVALLERAEKACTKPQCAELRRKAILKLLSLARARGDAEAAVRLAVREVGVIASAQPETRRAWSRTKTLDAACAAYEQRRGAGSCRVLERELLGRWSFHDFSKDAAGEGLSAERVRTVGQHYAPILQECLKEEASRSKTREPQRYEVRWVIRNDGQVREAHLRADLDATPLADCLRTQFRLWRYPRFTGEYQNVEQAFTVSAAP